LINASLSMRVMLHDLIMSLVSGRGSFRVPYWPRQRLENVAEIMSPNNKEKGEPIIV